MVVSPRNTFTRVSNNCLGGSMLWTLKGHLQGVNPLETTQCVRTFQDVSEGVRAIGCRGPRRGKHPRNVSAGPGPRQPGASPLSVLARDSSKGGQASVPPERRLQLPPQP